MMTFNNTRKALFSMILLMFYSHVALAADKLDNSKAEALCYSFIRTAEESKGIRTFGEHQRQLFAKNIRYAVAPNTEDIISRRFQEYFSQFRDTHWVWSSSERKKLDVVHGARAIRRVNPSTAPSGARYNLIVTIDDDNWVAGYAGYSLTFYLGPYETGVGPFKSSEWRIVDLRISRARY